MSIVADSRYPKRCQFFSMKFARIMAKTCAAQDIGADGCWLLMVIAGVEDVKRYSGAVTFYNDQLLGQCGFSGQKSLIRAREKCVEFGWLHYEQGGKCRPAKYWVTVPPSLDGISDFMDDESNTIAELRDQEPAKPEAVIETEGSSTVVVSETSTVVCAFDLEAQVQRKCSESAEETQRKCSANGTPSILSLSLEPIPKKTKAKKQSTPKNALDLLFEQFWEAYGKFGNKAPARKNWEAQLQRVSKTMSIEDAAEKIKSGASAYNRYLDSMEKPPMKKHAQGWLSEQRFEDDYQGMIASEQARQRKVTNNTNGTTSTPDMSQRIIPQRPRKVQPT